MHQANGGVEHKDQVALGLQTALALQAGLGDLDVPVADLIPEELLHAAGHVAKGVVLDALGDHLDGLGQTAEHPGVGRRLHDGLAGRVALHVHKQEAACVPDLRHKRLGLLGARAVDELLGLLVDVRIELDVLVVGAERQQVVAHSIGAVHADEVHGVNAVALGLGHAAAVLGKDCRVDDDVLKRHLVQEVQRAHDHAGDPQRDDVARGNERRRGVMSLEQLRLLRPALRGEGPQLRAKPGVQHVLVLMHVMTAALGAHIGVLGKGVLPAAVLAVEHGNAVAPPQLAADTPVLEVLHPGGVGLRPTRGVEGDLAGVDGVERRPLKLVDGDEPLLGQPRLKRGVTSVAVHDGVVVVLDMIEQVMLLKPLDDGLAALLAGHAGELTVALDDHRVLVEDVDLRQVVGLTHGVVVGVVSRRDLDEAGTEVGVDMPILKDGDLAVDDGELDGLTHEDGLLGVLRGDSDTRVAEHGLGARGGDDDVVLAVDRLGQRVAQVPKVALLVLVLGLVVRDGGGAVGAPIDDALAAIDQAVMIPITEDLAYGLRVVLVHGEALVIEVDGAAHALDLLDDDAAVLVGPIPAGVDKLVATDLQAADALALELLVDLGLRGDTGVVGAQHPARGLAAHAGHTDNGILDRVIGGVAHVELASHVGRRNGDGAVAHALTALVVAAVEPLLQDRRLVGRRIVILGHFFHISLPVPPACPPAWFSLGQVLARTKSTLSALRLVRNLRKPSRRTRLRYRLLQSEGTNLTISQNSTGIPAEKGQVYFGRFYQGKRHLPI